MKKTPQRQERMKRIDENMRATCLSLAIGATVRVEATVQISKESAPEHLWLNVIACDCIARMVAGTLVSNPSGRTALRFGRVVRIRFDDIAAIRWSAPAAAA